MKTLRNLYLLSVAALLAFALVAGSDARAADLSKLELTWQTVHAADCLQTMYIARNPSDWQESSSKFLIGSHPNGTQVIAWCALTSYGHYKITQLITEHVDSPAVLWWWQGLTIGVTAANVANNYSMGIRFSF
jgi:hypothetical protein